MSPAPKGWKPLTSVCEDALGIVWKYRLNSADGKSAWEFTPQEAADIIGASIDREVKGADLALPAEYADWVEVPSVNAIGIKSDYILVEVLRYSDGPLSRGERVHRKRFVPPKPKPTLPTGVGAVVAYTSIFGRRTRAIRTPEGWEVFVAGGKNLLSHALVWSDYDVLGNMTAEGFVTELDGLA